MGYTWEITQTDYDTTDGCIIKVFWTCAGDSAGLSGSTQLTPPHNREDMAPYAEVTEEMVLDWVWASGVDKEAIEVRIAAVENSTIGSGKPWVQEAELEPYTSYEPWASSSDDLDALVGAYTND